MLRLWNRLRLNWNALRLALGNRWLDGRDVAASYNALAERYEKQWAVHLRGVTHELLCLLPTLLGQRTVLDLGCGTGAATDRLARSYPGRRIVAVDISDGMLRVARERLGPRAEFRCQDMLETLAAQEPGSASLVFSAWAIGYSEPRRIIIEAGRVLEPRGVLAFVVNRMDTMPAVFDAYRRTMRQFPDALARSIWPRFPRDAQGVRRCLLDRGFRIEHFREGAIEIRSPDGPRIDWILSTGVLAGFDTALPLRQPGRVRDYFAEQLERSTLPLEHRFIMAVARRRP